MGATSDSAAPRLRTARPVARLRQGRNDWYTVRAQVETDEGAAAEVLIYDEIGYFGVTAQDFARDLAALDVDRLTVRVNSPGGEVFDGVAIYNALRGHRARVTTVVDALAASIASVIAQAGDERVVRRNATLMIHEGHGMAVGNAADMRELAELLDKTSDNIASIYAERAGGELAQWRDRMRAETWYSAEEAVAAGLADRVEGAADTEPRATWDLSIFNYAGRDTAPAPSLGSPRPAEQSPDQEPPAFAWDPEKFKQAFKELA